MSSKNQNNTPEQDILLRGLISGEAAIQTLAAAMKPLYGKPYEKSGYPAAGEVCRETEKFLQTGKMPGCRNSVFMHHLPFRWLQALLSTDFPVMGLSEPRFFRLDRSRFHDSFRDSLS